MTWRKRPSVCHREISRRRQHNRHNIWRNTPQHGRRGRFAGRTTSRTFCSNPRSPRRGACTWHVPFSRRPRATRSDGSTSRTQLGSQRRLLRTSASWRRAGCLSLSRRRTRARPRRRGREPKPAHSVRTFGNSWSSSFIQKISDPSRKQHASVLDWPFRASDSLGPFSCAVGSSTRSLADSIGTPTHLQKHRSEGSPCQTVVSVFVVKLAIG